jgi:hypothetical protein
MTHEPKDSHATHPIGGMRSPPQDFHVSDNEKENA